jgi:hypothetical protein
MGIMNSSEKSKFADHLRKYPKPCAICHGTDFDIADVAGMPILERGIPSGVAPGNQTAGVIPVVCKTCSHITFFSAMKFTDLS